MPETPPTVDYTVNQFLVARVTSWYQYLRSKWIIISITGILCAAAGLAYSFVKKPYYTAESTFVLEGGSSSGLGSYSNLAALAGISLDGGSGVFTGENIQELYRSRTMLEKTLLNKMNFERKPELMINRYIQDISQWRTYKNIDQLNFLKRKENFSKTEDSVLYEIVKEIRKKYLTIGKLDKKNIITVQFKFKDELFAYNFNQKLVENVNQAYVTIRTNKSLQNVAILQKQTDSVRRMMRSNVSGAAAATDVVPNANPYQQSLRVPVELKSIDARTNGAVYAELVRNLELAKVSLLKETPLIQSIDKPEIPLDKEEISKALYTVAGFIVGLFLGVLLLLARLFFRPASPSV